MSANGCIYFNKKFGGGEGGASCQKYWVKSGYLNLYSDGLRAGRPGFVSWQGQEIFLYSTALRPALGAHSASCPMGTGSAQRLPKYVIADNT
jgi:hypothetical protein